MPLPDEFFLQEPPHIAHWTVAKRQAWYVRHNAIVSKSTTASADHSNPSTVASTPPTAVKQAPTPTPTTVADIRDWSEPRFGITAERIRNCIRYQLDVRRDRWYLNQAYPTFSALNNEGYVRKLDADTPIGWTPETKQTKRQSAAEPLPVDMAAWMMLGPGVNTPLEGWSSARQKMDKIKLCWYGKGGENQPDPEGIDIEAIFSRYQKGLGINMVESHD